MSNKYHISQHVLWDNLKRVANIYLRKIDALPLAKRVKVFDAPPFGLIQKLLTAIGKELYKIVLYEVIESEMKKRKEKEWTVELINDVLRDFSFFFFPGYTTQDKKSRIFIEGLKIDEYHIQRRFFSGIGYKNVQLAKEVVASKNLESFVGFLAGRVRERKYRNVLEYEGSLYYKDNPMTLAYNLGLNKFYYANDYPKSEPAFQAGSTHFWKSQQVYEGQYIPFKLKRDHSELRNLHVGLKHEGEDSSENGKNKISLLIEPEQLVQSGEIISRYLSRDVIPIIWNKKEHKNAYVEWCYNEAFPVDINDTGITMDQLRMAQTTLYSYWVSETFNGSSLANGYSKVKNKLRDVGFDYIADNRVKTYKDYIQENPNHKEYIYETYFKNWYTLFLESYGPKANLGTIMLFTNHRLSPVFLNFCANFIRGIYNELRLAEALSLRQIKDFRSINHHHNKIINAFRYYIDGVFTKDESFSQDILTYYINLIEGFMNVEEMIQTRPSDLMQKKQLNVVEDVKKMIAVYRYFTKDYQRFSYLFGKLKVDDTHFEAYIDLKFLKVYIPEDLNKFTITYYAPVIQFLLKDLIENVIVHAELGSPQSEIEFFHEENGLAIEFRTNKWPTPRILNKMNKNSFGELSKGWATINSIIDTANAFGDDFRLGIKLPKKIPSALKKNDFFWIKLFLNNGKDK